MGGLKPSSAAGAALGIESYLSSYDVRCVLRQRQHVGRSQLLLPAPLQHRGQAAGAERHAGRWLQSSPSASSSRPCPPRVATPATLAGWRPQGYDIENPVGVWNNQQLDRINQLMLEASQRCMKLNIALHDRYALG
jgi:hypothetical protein